MCGCKSSTENNELYNEDVNVRHRFLFGVHVSKDPEGIEGNVQLACGTIKKKKYERVPPVTNTEQEQEQAPTQQLVNNPQSTAQHSRDNG